MTLETTRQRGTPQATAVTEDRRAAIKASWNRIPNAQRYRVRVYQNQTTTNFSRGNAIVLAPMTTRRFMSNLSYFFRRPPHRNCNSHCGHLY
ncbi:MAG: hypothetical protein ACNYNY_03365 [Candidatus Oxydemutatoraceae bacterium WSBS_2016_MAG_OTU14]